jgi:zinc protease
MKKCLCLLAALLGLTSTIYAQEVKFEEYDLNNGMHVILHQDNSAPVVTTSVMYHVGAKDENPDRTGFAHFFEHLLFEGTKNIPKGEWFTIVTSNGGSNNANTTDDRTYYYEVFPSNNVELGLWMESERLLHPVINQDGVDTQNEVVKEEKRLRVDNSPYGKFLEMIKLNMFKKHPYKGTTIGKMEHLDAATLEEFQAFNAKFYVPNNAVLVVAGDINVAEVKVMIENYFGPIPRGNDIERNFPKEDPITEPMRAMTLTYKFQRSWQLTGLLHLKKETLMC